MTTILSILTNIIVIFPGEGGVRGEWGKINALSNDNLNINIFAQLIYPFHPNPPFLRKGGSFIIFMPKLENLEFLIFCQRFSLTSLTPKKLTEVTFSKGYNLS